MSLKQLYVYIAKCMVGCCAVFVLTHFFPLIDLRWCLVSVALVMTPESREEVNLAWTRIKANLVAAAASMFCLLFGPADLLTVALAFAVTTFSCFALKLMAGNRSALAAVVIIMVRDERGLHWPSALERVVAVIVGCAVALAITAIFHYEYGRLFGVSPEPSSKSDPL